MTINAFNFDDLDSPIQICDDALDIGDPLPGYEIELLLGDDVASFDVSGIAAAPTAMTYLIDVGVSDDDLLESWFCQDSSRRRARIECVDQYRLFA